MDTFLKDNLDILQYDKSQQALKSTNKRYISFINKENFISSDDHSIVMKSYDKVNKNIVILKILNKKGAFALKDMVAEKLNHPNIISYIYTDVTDSLIFMYMKKYNYDMAEYILEKGKPLNEKLFIYFFKKIAKTIKYLHSNGVAHYDIKLENILVSNPKEKYPHIILSDFGFAEEWKVQDGTTPLVKFKKGSWNYASPELFSCIEYPITAPDIWSMGVCLFIMITLEYPFYDSDDKIFNRNIIMGEYQFPLHVQIPDIIKKYITEILITDPYNRPNIFLICETIF